MSGKGKMKKEKPVGFTMAVFCIIFVFGPMACSSDNSDENKKRKSFYYVEEFLTPVGRQDVLDLAGVNVEKLGLSKESMKNLNEIKEKEFNAILDQAEIVGYTEHGDYLGFSDIGEVKSFFSYCTITFTDGSTLTGKYAYMATLAKMTNGGPFGMGTERRVWLIGNAVLLEKSRTQPSKDLPRRVLPGELVIRKIGKDEAQVDDSYLIDFDAPPGMDLDIHLNPPVCGKNEEMNKELCFYVELKSDDGQPIALKWSGEFDRSFFPDAGKKYHFRIYGSPKNETSKTSEYILTVGFGTRVVSVWH